MEDCSSRTKKRKKRESRRKHIIIWTNGKCYISACTGKSAYTGKDKSDDFKSCIFYTIYQGIVKLAVSELFVKDLYSEETEFFTFVEISTHAHHLYN